MEICNELRSFQIATHDERDIQVLVRVQGISAGARGGSVVLEKHEPVAVVVCGPDAVQRLPLSQRHPFAAAIAAVPVAAYLISRILTKRRSRP
jgi:hypothetical protein